MDRSKKMLYETLGSTTFDFNTHTHVIVNIGGYDIAADGWEYALEILGSPSCIDGSVAVVVNENYEQHIGMESYGTISDGRPIVRVPGSWCRFFTADEAVRVNNEIDAALRMNGGADEYGPRLESLDAPAKDIK